MRFLPLGGVILALALGNAGTMAQAPRAVHGADPRFKADILVVVAHPDDEAGFTPYLARAIYDQHKRVVVVYGTRGGSGGNNYGREHGAALANIREMEAREACAKLGITNVWFLDGKDTASQNVLNSLASWGHGTNLEKLVGLVRLTRPEVILAPFPGVFYGENHGDHQAAGVLATEAFDLAGNPAVFPAQVAGDAKKNEQFLENLLPWQPKKLYFSSEESDAKKAAAYGPSYSIREISASQKKPYWRLALDAATPHLTQFPQEIQSLSKMSDAELEKLMSDPSHAWWPEPFPLTFGKSTVGGTPTEDVFAHTEETPKRVLPGTQSSCGQVEARGAGLPRVELGGPWKFYSEFYPMEELCHLPVAERPEIEIKAGTMLVVPLVLLHDPSKETSVTLRVKTPEGWTLRSGAGELTLPAEPETTLRIEIETPGTGSDAKTPQEVTVSAESGGKPAGEVTLRVKLAASALPE